jgi:hypothetical protein
VSRREHGDDRFTGVEPLGDLVRQQLDGVRGMVVEQDGMAP